MTVLAQVVLCLWEIRKNYAAHVLLHSTHDWLLGWSGWSSPSSKELHGFGVVAVVYGQQSRKYLQIMTSSIGGTRSGAPRRWSCPERTRRHRPNYLFRFLSVIAVGCGTFKEVLCLWQAYRMSKLASVTRLGDFWKFLATNFLIKVAQIFCNFVGCLFSRM